MRDYGKRTMKVDLARLRSIAVVIGTRLLNMTYISNIRERNFITGNEAFKIHFVLRYTTLQSNDLLDEMIQCKGSDVTCVQNPNAMVCFHQSFNASKIHK